MTASSYVQLGLLAVALLMLVRASVLGHHADLIPKGLEGKAAAHMRAARWYAASAVLFLLAGVISVFRLLS